MDIEPGIEYWDNGNKRIEYWYLNDILHRVDGPAFINGNLHRLDGPAIIKYFNDNTEEWYFNNKELSNKESIEYKEWLIDNNLYNKPYDTWHDNKKLLWKLTWF